MTTTRTRDRGELEGEVLDLLWRSKEPMSAMDLQALFSRNIPAYTTLMTALTRLERKGHVIRVGDSPRKIKFLAAQSGGDHAGTSMMSALAHASDRREALLSFAGNLEDDDIELLRCALRSNRKP
jgi:predicted transcriptional regulator